MFWSFWKWSVELSNLIVHKITIFSISITFALKLLTVKCCNSATFHTSYNEELSFGNHVPNLYVASPLVLRKLSVNWFIPSGGHTETPKQWYVATKKENNKHHCSGIVVILIKFSSLHASEVIKMISHFDKFRCSQCQNLVNMMVFSFLWFMAFQNIFI